MIRLSKSVKLSRNFHVIFAAAFVNCRTLISLEQFLQKKVSQFFSCLVKYFYANRLLVLSDSEIWPRSPIFLLNQRMTRKLTDWSSVRDDQWHALDPFTF